MNLDTQWHYSPNQWLCVSGRVSVSVGDTSSPRKNEVVLCASELVVLSGFERSNKVEMGADHTLWSAAGGRQGWIADCNFPVYLVMTA